MLTINNITCFGKIKHAFYTGLILISPISLCRAFLLSFLRSFVLSCFRGFRSILKRLRIHKIGNNT